jgi:hypothetical protein
VFLVVLYSESTQSVLKVWGRSGESSSEAKKRVRWRSFPLALQVCPEAEQTLVFRGRIRQRTGICTPHVRGSTVPKDGVLVGLSVRAHLYWSVYSI